MPTARGTASTTAGTMIPPPAPAAAGTAAAGIALGTPLGKPLGAGLKTGSIGGAETPCAPIGPGIFGVKSPEGAGCDIVGIGLAQFAAGLNAGAG